MSTLIFLLEVIWIFVYTFAWFLGVCASIHILAVLFPNKGSQRSPNFPLSQTIPALIICILIILLGIPSIS
jgi:hypothetical protein